MKKPKTKRRFAYSRWRRKHNFKRSISQLKLKIDLFYKEYFINVGKAAANLSRVMQEQNSIEQIKKAFDVGGCIKLPEQKEQFKEEEE